MPSRRSASTLSWGRTTLKRLAGQTFEPGWLALPSVMEINSIGCSRVLSRCSKPPQANTSSPGWGAMMTTRAPAGTSE
jgi:hypothetical protein